MNYEDLSMSENVIHMHHFRASLIAKAPAETAADDGQVPRQGHASTSQSDDPTTSGNRRKSNAKSRSVEPNIQEVPGEYGKRSFRVQIRKSYEGVNQASQKRSLR
ncbi:hypothetical protein [Paracoccus beibuensis]|uniref:hypothetical protein n=1 Tax=Paracoccus beibuensis TaxID=547602 RepID=UPI00223EBB9B|nr:hypothetical protein [Paracoccus beibuensis]